VSSEPIRSSARSTTWPPDGAPVDAGSGWLPPHALNSTTRTMDGRMRLRKATEGTVKGIALAMASG
jgi:hypothetical protein